MIHNWTFSLLGSLFELNLLYRSSSSEVFYKNIVIRNGKIVCKHEPYCWYFHLNLKYLRWPYRKYIKTKWWVLWGIASWKLLCGCFSHFLLLWLWCQRFWGSSEDRYRSKRLSQMLFVCYILLNTQNIPINGSEKSLVTYLLTKKEQ